ncbi:MAG: hypothetical protein AAF823_09285, partial [Planctomycetota bacterium]
WGSGGGEGIDVARPMLGVGREEVRALLGAIGQGWREDETNEDAERRARARLRRDVLPVLAELYPGAEAAAGRLADAAAQWRAARVVELGWAPMHDGRGWRVGRARLSAALAVDGDEALRGGLSEAGVPMGSVNAEATRAMSRAVRDGAGGERVFALAEGWRMVVTREAVEVTRPGEAGGAGRRG